MGHNCLHDSSSYRNFHNQICLWLIFQIQVNNQMLLISQSANKDTGHPNYSWLSLKPRLTSAQREKIEGLTIQVKFLLKR
jgi:hypothetical protein